eukprot:1145051-Pelagomonas_calceolata.AAC.7
MHFEIWPDQDQDAQEASRRVSLKKEHSKQEQFKCKQARLWGSNGRDGAERLTSVLPGTEEP